MILRIWSKISGCGFKHYLLGVVCYRTKASNTSVQFLLLAMAFPTSKLLGQLLPTWGLFCLILPAWLFPSNWPVKRPL